MVPYNPVTPYYPLSWVGFILVTSVYIYNNGKQFKGEFGDILLDLQKVFYCLELCKK